MLYGRAALLEAMPPWQGGGDMIETVTLEQHHLCAAAGALRGRHAAHRAGASGWARRSTTSRRSGAARIGAWEDELLAYATERVGELDGVRIIGTAREKAACSPSWSRACIRTTSGTVLDDEGIAIRAGHHCAQPVMRRFGVPATARASFAFYNTREEVDALVRGLRRVRSVFA